MSATIGLRGRLPHVALLGLLFSGIVAVLPCPAFAQDSPTTINSGPVTWGEGGEASFLIDKVDGVAGINWSLNNITGTLTFSSGVTAASTFTLDITSVVYGGDGMDTGAVGPATDFNALNAYTWTFVHTTGGVVGYDPAKVTLNPSSFQANNNVQGGQFFLKQLNGGNDLAIQFLPASEIPEPGAFALLSLGGALGLIQARRHRRSSRRR